MAITAKPQKQSAPSVNVEALINKGGSVATHLKAKENETDEGETKAVLLRVPVDILETVDAQIKGKRPRVPRHTWILEAILQRIERDG